MSVIKLVWLKLMYSLNTYILVFSGNMQVLTIKSRAPNSCDVLALGICILANGEYSI